MKLSSALVTTLVCSSSAYAVAAILAASSAVDRLNGAAVPLDVSLETRSPTFIKLFGQLIPTNGAEISKVADGTRSIASSASAEPLIPNSEAAAAGTSGAEQSILSATAYTLPNHSAFFVAQSEHASPSIQLGDGGALGLEGKSGKNVVLAPPARAREIHSQVNRISKNSSMSKRRYKQRVAAKRQAASNDPRVAQRGKETVARLEREREDKADRIAETRFRNDQKRIEWQADRTAAKPAKAIVPWRTRKAEQIALGNIVELSPGAERKAARDALLQATQGFTLPQTARQTATLQAPPPTSRSSSAAATSSNSPSTFGS